MSAMDIGRIVCGADAVQRIIVKERGWWVVYDAKTRECLSGGFRRISDAAAEARRLGDAP